MKISLFEISDPSIRDGEGSAAIHLAAQFGFWPICAYLVVRSGIDVDSYDTNGLTSLMWAVIRSVGPETIRVLIALGADPDLKDRREQSTSLHFAMEKGNEYAFNTLLEKTKELEAVNKKGVTPSQLGKDRLGRDEKLFRRGKTRVDEQVSRGRT